MPGPEATGQAVWTRFSPPAVRTASPGSSTQLTRPLAAGLRPRRRSRWRVTSGRVTARAPTGRDLAEPGRTGWDVRAVAALLHVGPPAAAARGALGGGDAWSLVQPAAIDPVEVADHPLRTADGRPRGVVRPGSTPVSTRRPGRTVAQRHGLRPSSGHGLDRAVALMPSVQLRSPRPSAAAWPWRSGRVQPQRDGCCRGCRRGRATASRSAARAVARPRTSNAHTVCPGARARRHPPPDSVTATPRTTRSASWSDRRQTRHEGWAAQRPMRPSPTTSMPPRAGRLTLRPTWVDVAGQPCRLAADLDVDLRASSPPVDGSGRSAVRVRTSVIGSGDPMTWPQRPVRVQRAAPRPGAAAAHGRRSRGGGGQAS